jgi:hypothetical protein
MYMPASTAALGSLAPTRSGRSSHDTSLLFGCRAGRSSSSSESDGRNGWSKEVAESCSTRKTERKKTKTTKTRNPLFYQCSIWKEAQVAIINHRVHGRVKRPFGHAAPFCLKAAKIMKKENTKQTHSFYRTYDTLAAYTPSVRRKALRQRMRNHELKKESTSESARSESRPHTRQHSVRHKLASLARPCHLRQTCDARAKLLAAEHVSEGSPSACSSTRQPKIRIINSLGRANKNIASFSGSSCEQLATSTAVHVSPSGNMPGWILSSRS